MRRRIRMACVTGALAIAALLSGVTSLDAATGHQVNPARTVMVDVVGSKISNARGGATIAGGTLKATNLNVDFKCGTGEKLTRGRVSTAAGSTGWRRAGAGSKKKGKGSATKPGSIRFSTVPLATRGALQGLCPANKKGSFFKEVTLELSAECQKRGGAKRVATTQFPQMVRLDCDQLEEDSKATAKTFWHTCPAGYVLKHRPSKTKEASSNGWGKPATCVRKK